VYHSNIKAPQLTIKVIDTQCVWLYQKQLSQLYVVIRLNYMIASVKDKAAPSIVGQHVEVQCKQPGLGDYYTWCHFAL
jgi:hypothetical protein